MRRTKKDFTVGQIVYLKLTNNSARGLSGDKLIVEKEVKAIGNKYITVGSVNCDYGFIKLDYEYGREKTEYSSDFTLYITKQDILDEEECARLEQEIKRLISDVPLKQLRKILSICNE